MRSLTWRQVTAYRLARSHLLDPAPPGSAAAVTAEVCGIQAQLMSAAELDLALRVDGLDQAGVREEVWERRTLVRTYGPRGTIHLLPAAEAPTWMAALAAHPSWNDGSFLSDRRLPPGMAGALVEVMSAALDGRCLTRAELADEVAARLGEEHRQAALSGWGDLLGPAAVAGRLCWGPPRGTNVTFVRADQWLGGWDAADGPAALAEVTRRWFTAYGPATAADFGAWFRMAPAEAEPVVAGLGDQLVPVDVDGRSMLAAAATLDALAAADLPPGGSVALVPQYDCYVLGHRQRDVLVPEATRALVAAHGRGRYEGAVGMPCLLVDGVVAGQWERKARGKRLEVRVRPAVGLSAGQWRAVEAAAERVAAVFGLTADVTVDEV